MAAPGRPKVCVAPSFSRMATAASTALIRGMVVFLLVRGSRVPGQGGDRVEEAGVVQGPVTGRAGGGHELGDERADGGDDALLAGGGGEDPQVLVVQLDAEAGRELPVEHLRRLLVEDGRAGQSPTEDLDGRRRVHAVGLAAADEIG